jgi:hypothetical protein
MSNFTKTLAVGAELLHADGRKERPDGDKSQSSLFFETA